MANESGDENSRVAVQAKDFKEFVGLYKDEVYQKECEYLPKGDPEKFNEIMRLYVDRRGQYRRPGYLLLWAALYGGKMSDAILPAAIQQMSEDYFLMQDDWMDSNEVRRNGPAAHVMYNPVYAVLASDTLHTILYRMAYDAMNLLGGTRGKAYFERLYDIMFTTHVGQYYDISLAREPDITKFTLEEYYKSIYAKSGYYTVAGPMQCGAIIGGASNEELGKMLEYGIPVGTAFQIKDDILDCTSTVDTLGKTIGNDVREGAKTIILWHAVQNASPAALERMKKIYELPKAQKKEEDVKWVIDTFNELGSINYAQAESERFTNQAIDAFKKSHTDMPSSPLKDLAINSIGHVASRSK